MPPDLIEAVDELRKALPATLSRAAVVRALLETSMAGLEVRDIDPGRTNAGCPLPPGQAMKRIVLRMPPDLIARIDRLGNDLRARAPEDRISRAALVRALLVSGHRAVNQRRQGPRSGPGSGNVEIERWGS